MCYKLGLIAQRLARRGSGGWVACLSEAQAWSADWSLMIRGVLLVVIDCLRADHVSAQGYARETTPTLDGLARRGILWEQAYSVSSWTKPSVTSILSGLYPSQHGAIEGIKRSRGRLKLTTSVLESASPTLAEVFSAHGWRCGAFINNAQLGRFSRLDRGFETYEPAAGKADRILEAYANWLRRDAGRPAFAYLHFLEAHWPYKPRRRHVAMFGGDRDTNFFRDFSARDFGKLRGAIKRKEVSLTEDHLEQMIQMYDGAIRRLDGKLRLLLQMIEESGLGDEVAVVVTADHGDAFLDHGTIGHGHSLYDELTHVPLVAFVPGGPSCVRRTEPVSQVNLGATLLGMAGIRGEMPGVDLLSPLASGHDSDRPVFGELRVGRRYDQFVRRRRWKLHRKYKFTQLDGAAARHVSASRLMRECPFEVSHELYDMVMDPSEREDLAGDPQYGRTVNEMLDALNDWWEGVSGASADERASTVEVDASIEERIRALGYVE